MTTNFDDSLLLIENSSVHLAIDLLEKMLELDADRRPTAEKALAHKYLSEYADITDEPTADPFDDSFEEREMATNEWKSKLSRNT